MTFVLSRNHRVTLLTALVLPVLLGLGTWQLQRAEEKRTIAVSYLARQQQAPVSISTLDDKVDLAFRRVALRGRFDNRHHFLLDNRMHSGQLGYQVLTPFLTERGQWLLVNRGWIQANPDRRNLPAIPAAKGFAVTMATVYVPPGEPFLLAEQDFRQVEWPLVVQAVEVDKFADVLERAFFPYVLRLQEGAVGALQVDWQPINVRPEKHTAYAVQWFAMAAALVLWFVFGNTSFWRALKGVIRRA